MKTSTPLYLLNLALTAQPLLAAPLGSPASSPNPANALVKRWWYLNCTNGRTDFCKYYQDTSCVQGSVVSQDNWCWRNCECYWQYECSPFTGCLTGEEVGNDKSEEKKGDEGNKVPETVGAPEASAVPKAE
ncbi:hypothetical protein VTJ04DRAFT_10380 [Mycothermus thermophilus]|uniref:uncharacterized protein n=1 Tax=Humicola insolens TaxID=85995 RepID=UPI0037439CCB